MIFFDISTFLRHFGLNEDKSRPSVIPLIQGSSEEAVWQICQQGFGIVATTDVGCYGKGIYFTSELDYAHQYAKKNENGNQCFILSLLIPGNTFPITESPFLPNGKKNPQSYIGKPCRPGYQSHLTIVRSHDISSAFPIAGDEIMDDPGSIAMELVVFESAQVLPLFVFYA